MSIFSCNSAKNACFGVIATLFSVTGLAQTEATNTAQLNLNEQLVVANRTSTLALQTMASVDLITRQEIEARQARDVLELLSGQLGISIASNGGQSKTASIFMRGTESDHTLILLDGQPINGLSDGRARLEFLNLDQIERIEIVRGGRSALYGSEAIGGVISITSRDTEQTQLRLELGSRDFVAANLNGGLTIGKTQLSFALATDEGDGIDARDSVNPDDDGFENTSYMLAATYSPSEQTELTLRHNQVDSQSEFDDGSWNGGTDGLDDYQRSNSTLAGHWRINENHKLEILAGVALERFVSNGVFGPFVSDSDRRNYRLELESNLKHDWLLVNAVEFSNEAYRSNFVASGLDRDNFAVSNLASGNIGRLSVAVAQRYDRNETYGGFHTGSLSLGLDSAIGNLYASYNTGFKAPNFFDLYGFGGNRDLQPEQSETFELGLKGNMQERGYSLAIFEIATDNLISYDPVATRVFNVAKARVQGAEAAYSTSLAGIDATLQYTHLLHKDLTSGQPLLRRPRNSLRLDLHRSAADINFSATLVAASDAVDVGGQRIDAYQTVEVRAQKDITEQLSIAAKLANALDQEYQTVVGFNSPRATFRISLSYRFE